MRIYYFCAVLILFISSFSIGHASTLIDSDISVDTVWNKSGSPYIISSTVSIVPAATLTITPGTIIKFDGGEIIVGGKLVAEGTPYENIQFTSIYNDDENEPSPYDYGGIIFLNATATSSLAHTSFSYVGNGIEVVASPISLTHVTVSNSGDGITANNSSIISDNLTIDTIDASAVTGFNSSSLAFTATTIKNVQGNALYIFGSSTLTFTEGSIENLVGNAFSIFNTSTATVSRVDIHNTHDEMGDTITLYNYSHLTLSDSTIDQSGDSAALLIFSNAEADIDTVDFSGGSGDGIQTFNDARVEVTNSELHNFHENGILGYNGGTLTVSHSSIKNNDMGVQVYTPITITISDSSILSNATSGILNYSDQIIDARNNWWGSNTGPGNMVSNNVEYEPWLEHDPLEEENEEPVLCCSNVLFIPGMESSRLYKKGFFFEDQLWEPNINSDVKELYMTTEGKSIDPSIYTRDIITRTNLPFFNKDIYRTFSDSMNNLVQNQIIKAWQSYPYDWRLDIPDIITSGALQEDGTYKKLVSTIEQLANTSNTGKVTIIAHSNGGLVSKALVTMLQDAQKEHLLDDIILVASPQLGTPQAVSGFLHGHNQVLGKGLLLNAPTARTFSLNAPVAYNLFPSKKYVEYLTSPLITFDPSLNSFSNLYSTYGVGITDYNKFVAFLTATGDLRPQPSESNITSPAVARQNLLLKSQNLHDLQDNWTPPSGIKIYQIVGTGLDTVSGIAYSKKSCGPNVCPPELDYAPMFSNKGDGTVMGMSASAMNEPVYFFNLQKYNKDTGNNINHAIILESAPVKNLIAALIKNENIFQNEYISTLSFSPVPQTKISIHSPVSIDLYDAAGRHTGLGSTTASGDIQLVEENIPNSYYLPFGEGVYTGVDQSASTTVVLDGTGVGTFTLTIESPTQTINYTDIPVLPDTKVLVSTQHGSSSPLKIDFDGNGTIDSTIIPFQDPDPLMYLEALKKFVDTLAIPHVQKDNLLKKIDKIITQIKNGKLKKAEITIKQYLKKYHHNKKFKKKLTPEEIQQMIQILTNLINTLSP